MSIRLSSHLHRNRYGIFGFRIVVPRDLRSWFRCTEFRVTLKTGETQVAKQLAAHLTVLTCERFNRLRRMSADARLSAAAQILNEIDTERSDRGAACLPMRATGERAVCSVRFGATNASTTTTSDRMLVRERTTREFADHLGSGPAGGPRTTPEPTLPNSGPSIPRMTRLPPESTAIGASSCEGDRSVETPFRRS
jgi:hypothetical protein